MGDILGFGANWLRISEGGYFGGSFKVKVRNLSQRRIFVWHF